MHFVLETTASAGVEHLFRLRYYEGEQFDSWEYHRLQVRERLIDVYSNSPKGRDTELTTNPVYDGYYLECPGRCSSRNVQHKDFLAARDLTLWHYSMQWLGPEAANAVQQQSACLLVIFKVLTHD